MMRQKIRLVAMVLFLGLCMMGIKPSGVMAQEGRETFLLNGTWEFYPNGENTLYEVKVPSYWDVIEGFGFPREWTNLHHGIYKKAFTIPDSMTDKAIFLHFDRMTLIGKLFVNGQEITDEYSNGYLMGNIPYKIDITSYAQIGANELEVRLWDAYGAPADAKDSSGKIKYVYGQDSRVFGQGRGISGDVTLSASSKVYVSDVYVITDLKKNTDPSDDSITLEIEVTNKEAQGKTVVIKNVAEWLNGSESKVFNDVTVTVAAQGTETITIDVPWTDARYWWTDDTNLYNLTTTLVEGSEEKDELVTRFGFRQFYRSGTHFELNGVKTNLRGDSAETTWHEYHPHGPATSASLTFADSNIPQIKAMLDEWKKLNFNVLRTHTGGAIKEIYAYADEIGLLVIDESKFNNYKGSITSDALENHGDWMKRWVEANRNYPSIVIWGASNEGWDWSVNPSLMPVLNNTIKSHDVTRPIIHDGNNMEDERNKHYSGGYPGGWLNHANLYGLYTADSSKPSGEGECFTPTQGWLIYNGNGTLKAVKGGKDYLDPDIASQATRHKGVGRMVRALRYAGYADIRPYSNWRYAFEVIEETIQPQWTDYSEPGIKPVELFRPIINAFDDNLPTAIPSESYAYTQNSFSAVAVFDKQGDKDNRIGYLPPSVSNGATQTRTLIIYNDEQRHGTDIEVLWEAGYYDPVTEAFVGFETGSFVESVDYGNKKEKSVQFTVPTGLSKKWLQLKVTAKKGTEVKFQETNTIGSINGQPDPKIEASTSNSSQLGIITAYNKDQRRKIKLINRGGGLSTNWTATNVPSWMKLIHTSGNLRGEQDLYYTIDTYDLMPNTTYSATITFTEAGGTSDDVTITFTTDDAVRDYNIHYFDRFGYGVVDGWTPITGTWEFERGDQDSNNYVQKDNSIGAARSVYGDIHWTDYFIQADIKVESFGSTYAGVGFDIHRQDGDNFYMAKYYEVTNSLVIRKKVNGTMTTIASEPFNFQTGTWYRFKLVANGNQLEFWVNDVLELSVTESALDMGQAALISHRANAKYKNIYIKGIE